ncbi:hypothetical protein Hanom_Chr00s000494g01646021 [Helianthus anomalus]
MAGKDVEIAELKRRLCESQEKVDSLEIDFKVEKLRADGAVEAREISQDNYAEIQSTVEPLVNNLEWLQQYGIAHISYLLFLFVANAMLNLAELDQTVAALTVAARHMGHCEGYTECASHVEATLKVKWDNSHCSTSAELEKFRDCFCKGSRKL